MASFGNSEPTQYSVSPFLQTASDKYGGGQSKIATKCVRRVKKSYGKILQNLTLLATNHLRWFLTLSKPSFTVQSQFLVLHY